MHIESPNDTTEDLPAAAIYRDDVVKFRTDYFNDQAAYEKVAEGLRIFANDTTALKHMLREKIVNGKNEG